MHELSIDDIVVLEVKVPHDGLTETNKHRFRTPHVITNINKIIEIKCLYEMFGDLLLAGILVHASPELKDKIIRK